MQGGIGITERLLVSDLLHSENVSQIDVTEIVLRRPGGEFYPASWLMSTLCHEVRSLNLLSILADTRIVQLAHIKVLRLHCNAWVRMLNLCST